MSDVSDRRIDNGGQTVQQKKHMATEIGNISKKKKKKKKGADRKGEIRKKSARR